MGGQARSSDLLVRGFTVMPRRETVESSEPKRLKLTQDRTVGAGGAARGVRYL